LRPNPDCRRYTPVRPESKCAGFWTFFKDHDSAGAEALAAADKADPLPLVFEPNLGQTDPQVRFLTRAAGMTSFLTDRENVMVLSRRKGQPDARDPHKTPEIDQTVVRMKLEGARAPRSFEGMEKAESVSNYFIGNDPSKWVANVPHYRKLRAHGVYPGIDLVYYGDGRKLEYDFVVEPGADPSRIRLAYERAERLTTDAGGNLLIATRLGTLVQRRPVVYQEINGERREAPASYSIRAGKVEIAVANWDRRRELVINPVLVYSTYLGGSANDYGRGIATDASGAPYVTGYTAANFPTTTGAFQTTYGGGTYDAFVTKLSVPSAGPAALITVAGGSPQSTVVHTAFGTALQAKVTDTAGNPVAGVTVTFAVPGSGTSATLPAGAATKFTHSRRFLCATY
jgi:hypothetical protein